MKPVDWLGRRSQTQIGMCLNCVRVAHRRGTAISELCGKPDGRPVATWRVLSEVWIKRRAKDEGIAVVKSKDLGNGDIASFAAASTPTAGLGKQPVTARTGESAVATPGSGCAGKRSGRGRPGE